MKIPPIDLTDSRIRSRILTLINRIQPCGYQTMALESTMLNDVQMDTTELCNWIRRFLADFDAGTQQ
jgi:hypothetical protein